MRSISDALFDQRPDSLTRIQLWRVGGQADERDALRDFQRRGAMRGCPVPHQHQALTFGRMLFGERVEEELHTRGVESRQHEPERASRSRMGRGIEPEPFVALINYRQWSLSNGCPDAAKYWLESEASFVLAPDFYGVCRIRLLQSLRRKF